MLKSLNIRNLTAFAEADLEFSPQLNVIVGENAVGKTHLLKVPYAVLATSAEEGRKPNGGAPTKASLQAKLADKLVGVLRPESLGRLPLEVRVNPVRDPVPIRRRRARPRLPLHDQEPIRGPHRSAPVRMGSTRPPSSCRRASC